MLALVLAATVDLSCSWALCVLLRVWPRSLAACPPLALC